MWVIEIKMLLWKLKTLPKGVMPKFSTLLKSITDSNRSESAKKSQVFYGGMRLISQCTARFR